MCPPFKFIDVGGVPPPPVPFDFVITNTGAFVVTSIGDNVIAVHT
jgi:hypothetical protein